MGPHPITRALSPFERFESVSLWRRWLDAFAARRQRQADRQILQSLRFHGPRLDGDFRVELERRLLGQ
jgi:hypothetical protein